MGEFRAFSTVVEAYDLLAQLGAPPQLILHVRLVGEAAELLIAKLTALAVTFDPHFVRLGVAFHDAGKILHPAELSDRGNRHEIDGERLLIANGVDPAIARCCRSHGTLQSVRIGSESVLAEIASECVFEELLVALADTLWKGKRNSKLEELTIERIAKNANYDDWNLFVDLDNCFENIAAAGDLRLVLSQSTAPIS